MPSDPYTIRPATAGDSDVIEDLWVALHEEQSELDPRSALSEDARERWENDYPVWLEDEECCVLAAVVGEERVVGFVHAEVWYPPPTELPSRDLYVNSIYVTPGHRNAGVGSALVTAVENWARERDIEQLRFGVLHANTAARSFWEDRGAAPYVDVMTMEVSPSD